MRNHLSACALVVALTLFSAHAAPQASSPAKGTEILWDTYGIPHIFAPDHPSLFHAYGYAQMEAHSELLVRLYAQARGRGAGARGEARHHQERAQRRRRDRAQQVTIPLLLRRGGRRSRTGWSGKRSPHPARKARATLPQVGGITTPVIPAQAGIPLMFHKKAGLPPSRE